MKKARKTFENLYEKRMNEGAELYKTEKNNDAFLVVSPEMSR